MPLFTHENAAEMARRGNLARWSRPRLPPPPAANGQPIAETDSYPQTRLARVREQLDSLDAAILAESTKKQPDGQRLNWLASAQERLADQECVLAGRPLPGSHRPSARQSKPIMANGLPEGWPRPIPSPSSPADPAPAG